VVIEWGCAATVIISSVRTRERLAGVSTATAYRLFASVDDIIQAFVLQLPLRAAELFDSSGGATNDALDSFARWNERSTRSAPDGLGDGEDR
jgi:AcrR family transcriptional regulator